MDIGGDHHAAGALIRIPPTVDFSLEFGRLIDQDIPQIIAFDEVVGQLVERSIQRIVQHRVTFKHTNKDQPVNEMVLEKGKTGAGSDQHLIAAAGRTENIRHTARTVQNVMKLLDL